MPLPRRTAVTACLLATALAVPAAGALAAPTASGALAAPTAPGAPPPTTWLVGAATLPTVLPFDGGWKKAASHAGLARPAGNCLEPRLTAATTRYRAFTGERSTRAVEHVVRAKDVAAAEKLARTLVRRLIKPSGDHGDCYAAWTKPSGGNAVQVKFHRVVDVDDELTLVIASGRVPGRTRPLTRVWAIGRDGRRVAVLELDHHRKATHDATRAAVVPAAAAAVRKLAG